MADATFADLFGSDLLSHFDASDASSIYSDTGVTLAADGEEVLQLNQQSDAVVSDPMVATAGPTYRVDFNSSGYAALEFDGVNDVLTIADAGFAVGGRFFVLCAYTYISGSTIWSRGSSGSWIRLLSNSTTASLQIPSALNQTPTLPSTKRVAAVVSGDDQHQIDLLGFCSGSQTSGVPVDMTKYLTLGALRTGVSTVSQFGAFALHEILAVGASCEWGQVLRAAKLMRSKWGLTDPNGTPQAATVGVPPFTGIGSSRRLGT